MGILNVTPDSFSDGGRFVSVAAAIDRVEAMVKEGVDLVDVGGESSRPAGKDYGSGAAPLSAKEEIDRVVPVVQAIATACPDLPISVDTCKPEVARLALEAGAHIINDISGLRHDDSIALIAAEFGAPLILMHAIGLPGALRQSHTYSDVVEEVSLSLASSAELAASRGVRDIVIDPGFGFGKSVADNLRMVAELRAFCDRGYPVLIGVSRKSTLGHTLAYQGVPRAIEDRLSGSLALTSAAILNGASIVRTHDIASARDVSDTLFAMVQASRKAEVSV